MQVGAVVVAIGAIAALALHGRARSIDDETDRETDRDLRIPEAPMATA